MKALASCHKLLAARLREPACKRQLPRLCLGLENLCPMSGCFECVLDAGGIPPRPKAGTHKVKQRAV